MEDIVKRIVLKFSSEGQNEAERALKSLSKSFNPKEINAFLKNIDSLQDKLKNFGTGLSSNMQKVSNFFKQLNEENIKVTERKLERIGRLLERQIENLNKLKVEGADPETIARRVEGIKRTSTRFMELADEIPYGARPQQAGLDQGRFGGLPRMAGMALNALNVAAIVSQAVGQAFSFQREYFEAITRNTTVVANTFKQHTLDLMRGDMSRALLYSDPRRAAQIRQTVQEMTRAKTGEELFKNIGTTLLGGLALAGGVAALTVGAPTGIGAVLGSSLAKFGLSTLGLGAGAFMGVSGIKGLRDYFFAGGKEVYQMQALGAAEERAKAQTLDIDLYRQFAARAPLRYEYQRLYGMGDEEAFKFRRIMRGAGVLNEEEMVNLLSQFRRFGTAPGLLATAEEPPLFGYGGARVGGAAEMARAAAFLSRRYGISRQAIAQSMQGLAEFSRGGAPWSASALEQILAGGRIRGIESAGTLEEFQRMVVGLHQLTSGRLSNEQVMQQLDRFLVQSENQYRAIGAVPMGLQAYGGILSGVSPLMQTARTARLLDLVRGRGGDIDLLGYQYLEALSPERLATLTVEDPVLKSIMQKTGVTQEEMAGRLQDFRRQMTLGTLRTTMAPDRADEIIKKIQSGETISEGDLRLLAIALGRTDIATDKNIETVLSAVKPAIEDITTKPFKVVDVEGRTLESQVKHKDLSEVVAQLSEEQRITQSTAAARQYETQLIGEQKLDEQIQEKIVSRIEHIFDVYNKQLNEAMSNIDQDVLAQPLQRITEAADRIAQVMEYAAQRISQGTGAAGPTYGGNITIPSSAYGQAKPKRAGER